MFQKNNFLKFGIKFLDFCIIIEKKVVKMKTYNSYINFLCDLIIMDVPNVKYKFDENFYDSYFNEIEPFQLRDTAKSTAVPKNNTIYIDLDKFSNEIDIYIALTHEVRHCGQYLSLIHI